MMKRIALLGALLVLAAPDASQAGWTAIDFEGTGTASSSTHDSQRGWSFQVTYPIDVLGLGLWDYQSNGINDVTVALWDASDTSTPLVQKDINNSNSSLVGDTRYGGQFRFLSLDAADRVTLSLGNTYVIGADMNGNRMLWGVTDVSPAPQVNYLESRYDLDAGFKYPAFTLDSGAYFGPNFTHTPEPGSLSMAALLSAAAGLVLSRRRRACRRQAAQ